LVSLTVTTAEMPSRVNSRPKRLHSDELTKTSWHVAAAGRRRPRAPESPAAQRFNRHRPGQRVAERILAEHTNHGRGQGRRAKAASLSIVDRLVCRKNDGYFTLR
jgi:hypothetical protein